MSMIRRTRIVFGPDSSEMFLLPKDNELNDLLASMVQEIQDLRQDGDRLRLGDEAYSSGGGRAYPYTEDYWE